MARHALIAVIDELPPIKDVAKFLRLTDKSTYRLTSEGKLSGFKVVGEGGSGVLTYMLGMRKKKNADS